MIEAILTHKENKKDFVNMRDNSGRTALMIAAEHGGKHAGEMVEVLINKGEAEIPEGYQLNIDDHLISDLRAPGSK